MSLEEACVRFVEACLLRPICFHFICARRGSKIRISLSATFSKSLLVQILFRLTCARRGKIIRSHVERPFSWWRAGGRRGGFGCSVTGTVRAEARHSKNRGKPASMHSTDDEAGAHCTASRVPAFGHAVLEGLAPFEKRTGGGGWTSAFF